MKARSFRLIHIRNFNDIECIPDDALTILSGPNGTGKTNILEALSFVSQGRSFRAGADDDLIRIGDDEGTIIMTFETKGVVHTLKIRIYRNQGKELFFNETPVLRRDLPGLFRTVLFTPDELMLIKGAPALRRRFLDNGLSQISPRYYEELNKYNRAVQQRNAELRDAFYSGREPLIDIWDMQLAVSGSYIVRKRAEAVDALNQIVSEKEAVLTGKKEKLHLTYMQRGAKEITFNEAWFIKKLVEARNTDSRLFHTSVGPHRDDLVFYMNDMDISLYGSQGQQRTAILALKLSEIDYIQKETSEYPVLLLDDVGSELDRERQKALLLYLQEKQIQTIVTSAADMPEAEGKMIDMKDIYHG
ncbi:MAG: DNA replication/repair protein RecF [Dialister sp.]|nr:DNA replication/repair protein RecF [Dialister sp.]